MNKAEILRKLRSVPTGNVQSNQQILAEALIYIIENKDKVNFT